MTKNYLIFNYLNSLVNASLKGFNLYALILILSLLGNNRVFSQLDFSSTGNFTLAGTNIYSNFILNAGDTLNLQSGEVVAIYACQSITINGFINGNGRGFSAGTLSNPGDGPGGGGISVNAGAGGAGYGGAGGNGGYDSGDLIGAGGPAYGSAGMQSIQLGSGGGSSDVTLGGNGGGAIILWAPIIVIDGNINMNGANTVQPGAQRGGGGGAGGGVLIIGEDVEITSTISANGGDGSVGSTAASDSGGGGGGGRIKIYYGATLTNTGTLSVAGGMGGPKGDAAPGQDGQTGSTFISMTTFNPAPACLPPIPTLTQWGLFLFGLIVFTVFGVGVYNVKQWKKDELATKK